MVEEIIDMIHSSDEEMIRLGVTLAKSKGHSDAEIMEVMIDYNKYYNIELQDGDMYLVNKYVNDFIKLVNNDPENFVWATPILNNPL